MSSSKILKNNNKINMIDLITTINNFLNGTSIANFLFKLSGLINLFTSAGLAVSLALNQIRKFYRIEDLGLHPVFTELDEAYLEVARVPFKNEYKRRTILLWHKIVFDYQKQYALVILKLYKENDKNINNKLRVYAQETLNDMTISLQTSLPPKTERLYSSFAYVARDQLRDVLLYYLSKQNMSPKEKVKAIYRNLVFYSKYTYLIASLQNELNGELKGEYYTDPLTKEVYLA